MYPGLRTIGIKRFAVFCLCALLLVVINGYSKKHPGTSLYWIQHPTFISSRLLITNLWCWSKLYAADCRLWLSSSVWRVTYRAPSVGYVHIQGLTNGDYCRHTCRVASVDTRKESVRCPMEIDMFKLCCSVKATNFKQCAWKHALHILK